MQSDHSPIVECVDEVEILPKILDAIQSWKNNTDVCKYSLWTLSNYVASGTKYATKFNEIGGGQALTQTIELASKSNGISVVRSEALWVLCNLVTTGLNYLIFRLMITNGEALSQLIEVLTQALSDFAKDEQLMLMIIQSLQQILLCEKPGNLTGPEKAVNVNSGMTFEMFLEHNVIEKIRTISINHSKESVWDAAEAFEEHWSTVSEVHGHGELMADE